MADKEPIIMPGQNIQADYTVDSNVKHNFRHTLGNVVIAATEDTLEAVLVFAAAFMWIATAAITFAIFLVPQFGYAEIYNHMTALDLLVRFSLPGFALLVLTNTASASFVQNGLGRIDLLGTVLGTLVVTFVALVVAVQVVNGYRPLPSGEQFQFLICIVLFGIFDWACNQHVFKQARSRRQALMNVAAVTTAESRAPAVVAPVAAAVGVDLKLRMLVRKPDGSEVEVPAT